MRYARPLDVAEAVIAVAGGGTPLAGGTILVPAINSGLIETAEVVDLGRIPGLAEITQSDDGLTIGAATTLARLASADLRAEFQSLVDAAQVAANPLVRRSATAGGNIAALLPVLDLPPCLLSLRAHVLLRTTAGESQVPIDQVLAGGARTGLITKILVASDSYRRSGFIKYAWRRATGTAIVNVAVAVAIEQGRLARPAIAVGGLPPHARRLSAAEMLLDGGAASPSLIQTAARRAAAEMYVVGSQPDGDDDYRRGLVELGVNELLSRLVA